MSAPLIGERELAEVQTVFESGYLGQGESVALFEKELASYLSNNVEVVCTSSGTSALHLALQASGLSYGDEVLMPSLTFVASAQAVTATGARPRLCDVRLQDGLLDLSDVESKLNERCKAIMPVHYAGYAGDLNSIYQFAEKNNLKVIEDAAHAFGSVCAGQKIGTFDGVSCFSFDPIKNITCGEGGAVVTRNSDLAAKVRAARKLGMQATSQITDSSAMDYDVVMQGWRYHMPNINAAIGRVQLSRFEQEFAPKRKQLLAHYRQCLKASSFSLLETDEANVVPHIFPVLVHDNKNDLIEHLKQEGIVTGVHYKPVHKFSFYKDQNLQNSDWLYERLLTLPLHAAMSLQDVDRVCDVIKAWEQNDV